MRGLVHIGLVVAMTALAIAAQPKWRLYTAPDKSFLVELPWNPNYRRLNVTGMVRGSAGPFAGITSAEVYDLSMYIDESATSFTISVYEVVERRSEEQFIAESDSVISRLGGQSQKLLTKDPVTVSGHQGREYTFQRGKGLTRALIVNGGKRIYFVRFYTEDKKGVSRGPVNRVFNTFQPAP